MFDSSLMEVKGFRGGMGDILMNCREDAVITQNGVLLTLRRRQSLRLSFHLFWKRLLIS